MKEDKAVKMASVVTAVEGTTTTVEIITNEESINHNINNISIMTIITINYKEKIICHTLKHRRCFIELCYHHIHQTVTMMGITTTNSSGFDPTISAFHSLPVKESP